MIKNTEKKEMGTKSEEILDSVSSGEESSSSKKAHDKQTETAKMFCEDIFHKMQNVEMGAFFTGVEDVAIGAKTIDTKITQRVNGLLSNLTVYFRNSIDTYKKTKK